MSAARRRVRLARLVGVAAAALVGVTWPLWLPPTPTSFPQLPLFGWLIFAPAWCDWAALAGILLGAAGMAIVREPEAQARRGGLPPRLRFGLTWAIAAAPALFTLSLALALALNQLRVQVWAYQFLLLGAVLALCPRTPTGDRAAVSLARVLAVGILFHSGLSKLDLAFAEGPGRWLTGGFLSLFGVEADGLPKHVVSAVAFAVPAWEIALAVLLAVPGTRRVGLVGAVFMHVSVTATLWRLDQSWGVILWNAFFLAHEFVLFWPERISEGVPIWATVRSAGWRAWPAAGLIAAAVLLPFGTRSGYWDVWPGWAVYAGGVPRVKYYQNRGTEHPPSRLALFLNYAPLPQDPRVWWGVVAAIEAGGPAESVRVVVSRPAGRMTTRREERETSFGREAAIWEEGGPLDQFLLNAHPRALSLPPDAR